MELLAKEMDGRALKARLTKVGVLSKADINEAVRNDLGDLSMSGWRRGNPIEVAGRFDVQGTKLEMSPAKPARGPMRVLEQGREQRTKGDRVESGLGRARKDGTRRMRYRTAKRNAGRTQGKDTWTDATKIMERKMPDRYERALRADIARHIRGS